MVLLDKCYMGDIESCHQPSYRVDNATTEKCSSPFHPAITFYLDLLTQAAFIPTEKYLIIIIKRHVKPIDTCGTRLLLFIERTFWRSPLHSQAHREVVQNHDYYHRGLLPHPEHKIRILVLHPYFWTKKPYLCCNFQPHMLQMGIMLWSVYDTHCSLH